MAASLSKGFYIGTRESGTVLRLYKGGALAGSDGTAVVHARPNQSIYAFAWNSAGAAGGYAPARGSFYSIGHGLNAFEAALLHDAVQALQRNLNRNVD
jgi:hypothetical protein